MKKTTKIALLKVLFAVLVLSVLFGTVSFAASVSGTESQSASSIIQAVQPKGKVEDNDFAGKILALVKYAAIAIALGMLLIIGIQYVSGSSDQKAKIKDSAITYLFGAVLIFGAVGVLTAIEKLVSNIA